MTSEPNRSPSRWLRWPRAAALLAGLVVVAACGSNGSSSPGPEAGAGDAAADGGAYTLTYCPSQAIASSACNSCLHTSCGEELDDVDTSCADYYACLCPTGATAASCSPSTACTSALIALNDECTTCDVCGTPSPDAGGYSITNCPAAGVPPACASCLQTSCPTELSTIDTACASLLACACPVGANASACAPSTTCELDVATALVECAACDTDCLPAETDGGPPDAESDAPEPVESGPDVASPPSDAGPDATVDASGPLEAGPEGGEAAVPSDAASDAGADALAPADAAPPQDAGPEAAAPSDAQAQESDDAGTADGS